MKASPKLLLIVALLHLISLGVFAQSGTPEKGPPVGQKLPAFSARDQFGHDQTLASLTGKKGLVLLFFRSADW
jgi:hypothetical protein